MLNQESTTVAKVLSLWSATINSLRPEKELSVLQIVAHQEGSLLHPQSDGMAQPYNRGPTSNVHDGKQRDWDIHVP